MSSNTINLSQSIIASFMVIALSALFGYLEVQIEGRYGWAKSLPTWTYNMNGFVWTGYHVSLWAFLLIFIHVPFLLTAWTPQKECFLLSFLVIILLMEDAFWFLMNKNFCGEDPWRVPKFGYWPRFFFVGAFFVLFLSLFTKSASWIISCFILLLLIFISFPFQVKKCL